MVDRRDHQHLPRSLWWVLAGLTLAWGFNWTAMKVALSEVGPWTFRALCLAFGAALLFSALRVKGAELAVPRGYRVRTALLALVSITLWNAQVAFALTMIPSGRTAILAYTMPAWAIPLSAWLLNERISARRLLGLALGMGGIGLLFAVGTELGSLQTGSLLALGAGVSWALGSVLQRKYPVPMGTAPFTAWLMLLGGVPITLCALAFEDPRALASIGLLPTLGVVYNVVVAFAWGQWAWIKLVTSVPLAVSSLSTLLIPVIGVFSGMLFLGERPAWQEYAALVLVIGSLLSVIVPARGAQTR